ncbi:unnamed protein product, partial [marine sediment metagenome]
SWGISFMAKAHKDDSGDSVIRAFSRSVVNVAIPHCLGR